MDGWTESSKGVSMVIGIGYSRWEYFYLNQVLDCIYNRTPLNGKMDNLASLRMSEKFIPPYFLPKQSKAIRRKSAAKNARKMTDFQV